MCTMTGLLAHGAILAALHERTLSGRGQRVDTSLMEAQLSSLVNMASNYLVSGEDHSVKLGTAHPSIVPYQAFKCGDGKFVSVAVGNNGQFHEFCRTLGREELSRDERFCTNEDRVRRRDEIIPLLDSIFVTEDADHWLRRFEGKGFPSGPVRTIAEAFECPQVSYCYEYTRNIHTHTYTLTLTLALTQAQDRGMVQEIEHPTCGPVKVVGVPVKYSRTPCNIRLPPPLLGEHTDYILREVLGLTEAEVNELVDKGAVSMCR